MGGRSAARGERRVHLPGRYKGKKKGLASSAGRREGGEEEEEEGVLSSFLGRQTPGNRREEGRSMKEVNAREMFGSKAGLDGFDDFLEITLSQPQ
jgi:hypothetical protein